MKDIKQVVNKILEGVSIREAINTSDFDTLNYLVAHAKKKNLSFKLDGDLYGIDSVVVISPDGERTKFDSQNKIYCASGDTVELYSFLNTPFWQVLFNSGKKDFKGEVLSFIVPDKASGDGSLLIFDVDNYNDYDDVHQVDISQSKGWCKIIHEFFI